MSGTSSNTKYGKTRKGFGTAKSDTFKGYVDIYLMDEDRERAQDLDLDTGWDAFAFITDLLENGYKFSLALDVVHSMYIATAIGKADACANKDYALSGRGPTARGAVAVLYVKVVDITHWGNWVEEGGRDSTQLPLWS